ncbi:MAG: hypothetical protein E7287_05075 [Lachnospiraceae bacterium]|nr:hypothetical protein [Lachnospiraceae bacterium]
MPKKGAKIDISEKEWAKIKTEYITTEISYRNLAEKFGMSYTRLYTRAHAEKWGAEREEFQKNLVKKSIDLICDEQAERIARAMRIGDKMLERVEESLEQIDMLLVKTTETVEIAKKVNGKLADVKTTTEKLKLQKVTVDRAGLKQLSAVLKDLREIGIFRSELDRREQEARIDRLRKDTEVEQKDTEITVTFESIDDYAD